jgi:hypothetical protein
MTSQVLYSDRLNVHYGQFYVEPADGDFVDMDQALAGQSNGICGAAQSGRLFIITGIHTGSVHVTVERLSNEPPVDDSWEEIVECSFTHSASSLFLREWAAEAEYKLDLAPGTYRVRYCAKSMLADWQLQDGDGPLQVYLLQFWPEKARADEVLKVTGECAQYWHSEPRKRHQ